MLADLGGAPYIFHTFAQGLKLLQKEEQSRETRRREKRRTRTSAAAHRESIQPRMQKAELTFLLLLADTLSPLCSLIVRGNEKCVTLW